MCSCALVSAKEGGVFGADRAFLTAIRHNVNRNLESNLPEDVKDHVFSFPVPNAAFFLPPKKPAIMPAKEEFKAKPSSKQEKNKPKGGKAKDEERAKAKAKKAEKAASR